MDKKIKIFGFGSLLSEQSLLGTVPSAVNIIPCKLYGFIRIFNAKSSRYCNSSGKYAAALNIEKSEYNQYLNGICFEMSLEELSFLKQREQGYEIIKVSLIDYKNNEFSAFTFRYPHFEADYDFLENSKPQQDYLNLCLSGAESFGEYFFEEFLETTFIGKKTLKQLKEEGKNYL